MIRTCMRQALLVSAIAAASNAMAQQAPAPATPEACAAIEVDVTRLACYDAAFKHGARDTRAADAAARQAIDLAKQERNANTTDEDASFRERARRRLGAVFGDDDATALANAGKGSLLDSRWELAKDSKLGVFQMRAYKPVYLMPAFWTSNVNETPSSPNPDNTVIEP